MSYRTRDPLPATPPTWEDYWAGVGNEDWLYARELIDLSPAVRDHFAGYLEWGDSPVMVDAPGETWGTVPDPSGEVWRDHDLDWAAAAAAADSWAASSTEQRLLTLVLSLVQPDDTTRTVNVRDLSQMGSWRGDVAAILARYVTGTGPLPTG